MSFFPFNSCTIREGDNEGEVILICRLRGFNPTDVAHFANAIVENNRLIVTATMGDRQYRCTVDNIDVDNDAVTCEPRPDEVWVRIKKPNKKYSLASKLPK